MQDNVPSMKKTRFVLLSINHCKHRVYKYQNIFYFYFNRPTTKAPKKTKPAPHVEPGYSLYSSLSEDSTQETCVRLLNQLTEKRKTGYSSYLSFCA